MEVVGPSDDARDEGEYLASAVVETERARGATEADAVEMVEQSMHRGCPRSGRAAHGVADAYDLTARVAAVQRSLGVCHWPTSLWKQLAVGQLRDPRFDHAADACSPTAPRQVLAAQARGDGVLPGLKICGVVVGEFAEPEARGAGERSHLVGDFYLAVAAGGMDDDRDGAGPVARSHACVGDALAPLAVEHEPDGGLAVGLGFEDGARLGVVRSGSGEPRLPAGHPILFAAWREEAECLIWR